MVILEYKIHQFEGRSEFRARNNDFRVAPKKWNNILHLYGLDKNIGGQCDVKVFQKKKTYRTHFPIPAGLVQELLIIYVH